MKISVSEKATNILTGVGVAALAVLTGVVCKRGASVFVKNIAKTKKYKAFNNMSEFSNLTRRQKRQCYPLLDNESPYILSTIRGVKPACTFGIVDENYIQAVKNLRKGNFQRPVDFIQTVGNKNGKFSVHILNRNEVYKVIERNREIFTNRFGLPIDADTHTIYMKLCSSIQKSVTNGNTDLLGMTLGYPKYSTMMAELGTRGKIPWSVCKNPSEFKKAALEVLNSDKSPYKTLSQTEKERLAKAVESIDNIKSNEVGRPIYPFVEYVSEPEELKRIAAAVEQFRTINPELYNLCCLNVKG